MIKMITLEFIRNDVWLWHFMVYVLIHLLFYLMILGFLLELYHQIRKEKYKRSFEFDNFSDDFKEIINNAQKIVKNSKYSYTYYWNVNNYSISLILDWHDGILVDNTIKPVIYFSVDEIKYKILSKNIIFWKGF